MEKDSLLSDLQALERKLNILITEHVQLKQEIFQLRQENSELHHIIKFKDNQLDSFQNKIKISKLVENVSGGDNNIPELKLKIDDYIKEIDKCILLLSK
jgi:regulator of replication initiation timing